MSLSKSEAFSEVDASRARLLELLENITDEQWNAQSLCHGWNVRSVVSHISGGSTLSAGKFLGGMLKSRFDFDKVNDRLARERGERPISEVLEEFRSIVGSRKLPPTVSSSQFLVDVVAHTLDIAWPLGIEVEIPDRQMTEVLAKAITLGQPFLCRERSEGLRLVDEELEWSHGSGPEIRGPGPAILLGILGRSAALERLEGDGVEVLRSRL